MATLDINNMRQASNHSLHFKGALPQIQPTGIYSEF